MKIKIKKPKRTVTIIALLVLLTSSLINCEGNKTKPKIEKSPSNIDVTENITDKKGINDSINFALGAFTVRIPSNWSSLKHGEIFTLREQYQAQSKQIYEQYSQQKDPTKPVDIAAFHILDDGGTFIIVSFAVPPQSNLIALLKSQITDKMDWGVREGYIRKYLGVVEVESEQFSGFYTKAIGNTGEIEISGGLKHKKLKDTIIQLTLLCPTNWDETQATNTINTLLNSVMLKTE